MIKRLTINNFQCHRRLDLELDRITTIVGPSDTGKSAVIRALRWCLFNNPSGTTFITNGKTRVRVRVELDDGTVVTRQRTKSSNEYVLDDRVFKSFVTSVPNEVQSAVNMDESINLQSQHESPFWLSLSPSSVARELNAIVDLSVIDTVLDKARRLVRETKTQRDYVLERVEKCREELNGLAWTGEFLPQARDLTARARECQERASKRLTVERLLRGAQEIGGEVKRLSTLKIGARKCLEQGARARDHWEKVREGRKRQARVERLLTMVEEVEGSLCHAKEELERARDALEQFQRCPTCGTLIRSP